MVPTRIQCGVRRPMGPCACASFAPHHLPAVRGAGASSVAAHAGVSYVPVLIPLSARNVTLRFGATTALADVSVDAPAGAAVAIVGESGAGKTTLLRCFNRMVEPDGGEVRVGDVDVRTQDPIALRRRLGYAQQNGGLLPHWTAAQNVGLVLRALGRPDPAAGADALSLLGPPVGDFGPPYPAEPPRG